MRHSDCVTRARFLIHDALLAPHRRPRTEDERPDRQTWTRRGGRCWRGMCGQGIWRHTENRACQGYREEQRKYEPAHDTKPPWDEVALPGHHSTGVRADTQRFM